jgi:hypothetical protein
MGVPLKGIPLKGMPFIGAACAATVLHSIRPQQAATIEAVTVALKNRAERLMVRRVCVAMLCSFGQVSRCASAGLTIPARRVSAHEGTAMDSADLDASLTLQHGF